MYAVYYIKNKYNGRVYVGSTSDIKSRKIRHFYLLRLGTHKNRRLQKDYNRYGGKEAFDFNVICEVSSSDIALRFEQLFIDGFASTYNILPHAGLARGRTYMKSTLERMSQSAKGRKLSDKQINQMRQRMTGKKLSEETRRKMQDTHRKRAELGLTPISSSLSEQQVIDIIIRHQHGEERRDLAHEYGIGYSTVCSLIRGDTWKRVHKKLEQMKSEGVGA